MKKATSGIGLFLFAIFCYLSSTTLTGCGIGQCSNTECIQEKIDEGEDAIDKLQNSRNVDFKPLYDQYLTEYNSYIRELPDEVNSSGIRSHEELLQNCSQYYQICNKLERTAILEYLIERLGSKIKKIDFQISKLDQNVWKFKRKIEMNELNTSSEESNQIKELIATTEILIKDDTTTTEVQDVAKIEQKIFNKIISGGF
jgi:archaellum component FlaC